MQIGSAQRGNSETFLVHIFGRGLDDECCSAPTLDADQRGNVLVLLDAGGSNADA